MLRRAAAVADDAAFMGRDRFFCMLAKICSAWISTDLDADVHVVELARNTHAQLSDLLDAHRPGYVTMEHFKSFKHYMRRLAFMSR